VSGLPPPARLLDLVGTVVAVTGSSGGIGAGIARRFSEAGAAVVLHSRSSDTGAAASRLDGPTARVAVDLTDPEGPDALVAAAVDAFGRLDAVVNSAGIQPLSALGELSDTDWTAMLDTNVTSVHRVTQAAARHMVGRGGGGAIVHVASVEGLQPAPLHGHYATSKAAVIMHARAAALEYGRHGIRVNCVSPGLIDRPGLAEQWPDGVARWREAAPLTRLGTPEDVGDACVFLCSPLARWVTGGNLVVDGGVLTRPTW
jgi:NAD(P)-dependent dehydrogenase (short-subunit alcohol dehydrogenase family)